MISAILTAIGFIKKVFKVFKIAKTMITVINLVNTCGVTQNTISMRTKNGVDVIITIGKQKDDDIIDVEEVKEIDTKDIINNKEKIDDKQDIG